MVWRHGKTVYWMSYNRMTSSVVLAQAGIQVHERVEHNGDAINFTYGPDRQRIKEEHYSGGTLQTRTTVVGPHFEKVEEAGLTVYKHYIRAGSRVVAIHDRKSDGQHTTHYLHRDHLGSVDAITDKDGNVIARMSFDAFGQRRGSADWNIGFPPGTELDPIRDVTTRGYTGHHMVDAVKLIHMGGRIYDPALGRFLSPDPNIPEPGNTQAYNRYAYVYNNPLSFTDPNGFVAEREEMTQAEWEEYWEKLKGWEKKKAQEARSQGRPVGYRHSIGSEVTISTTAAGRVTSVRITAQNQADFDTFLTGFRADVATALKAAWEEYKGPDGDFSGPSDGYYLLSEVNEFLKGVEVTFREGVVGPENPATGLRESAFASASPGELSIYGTFFNAVAIARFDGGALSDYQSANVLSLNESQKRTFILLHEMIHMTVSNQLIMQGCDAACLDDSWDNRPHEQDASRRSYDLYFRYFD